MICDKKLLQKAKYLIVNT